MDLSDKRLKLTPKRLEVLHQLGLHTTDDLLMYYPYRYEVLQLLLFQIGKSKIKSGLKGKLFNFREVGVKVDL